MALKHPDAEPGNPDAMLDQAKNSVEPIIFEQIDSEMIKKAAKATNGSAGPTKVDADTWKNILCSKVFTMSAYLFAELAAPAKIPCDQEEDFLHT